MASVEKRAPFLVIQEGYVWLQDPWRDLSGLFCNSPQRGHGFFRDLASGGWFSLSLGSPSSFWKWHLPKSAALVAGGILGVCLLIFAGVEGLIMTGMFAKGKPELDYLVILGAQVRGTVPSRALRSPGYGAGLSGRKSRDDHCGFRWQRPRGGHHRSGGYEGVSVAAWHRRKEDSCGGGLHNHQ